MAFQPQVVKLPMSILKFVSGFTVGLYAGIYTVQNYNIPYIPEPGEIYNVVMKTIEKFKKDKPDE